MKTNNVRPSDPKLPKEWTTKTLADISEIEFGKAHEPFVHKYGEYTCITAKFISSDGSSYRKCTKNLTPAAENDVLMVLSDLPNGKALAKCLIVDQKNAGKYAVNQRIARIKPTRIYPKLLYYILNRNKYFLDFDDGVNQTHLANKAIKNFALSFPTDTSEQRAIADALSDIDSLAGSLADLIDKKNALQTGIMNKLLNHGLDENDRSEWINLKIGEFSSVICGGTPSTHEPSYWNGDIPWMSSGELHNRYIYSVKETITEDGLNNSPAKLLPKNCVLLGLAGQGKTRGTAAINRIKLSTNQSIGAILPSSNVNADFLYFNLKNRYTELREMSSGDGGRGGLNKKIIENIVVSLPPLEQQIAISKILSSLDNEISNLRKKLIKVRKIKDGMMQALLGGEVRLT